MGTAKIKIKVLGEKFIATLGAFIYKGISVPETDIDVEIPEQIVTATINVPDPVVEVPPVAVPPVTPPVALGQLFDPAAFPNKPLPSGAKLRSDSLALVDYLAGAAHTKDTGGLAVYFPGINVNEYTAPFFEVTDAAVLKSKLFVENAGSKEVLTWTELHKQLQAEGFRLPLDLAGSKGTDGSGLVWDKVDDSILEFWQYREEGGIKKISWGAVLKNVSKHPGYIAALSNGEKQGSRASGIALAVGIMRLQELKSGKIPHALAFAAPDCALNAWLAPAQRTDSWDNNPSVLRMGTLFRLPAGFTVPIGTAPIVKMMLEAIRDYGAYVVDTTAGNNLGFQVEDIGHLAPAGTADRVAWAWDQYKEFWGGRQSWDLLRSPAFGGQFPWEQLQAVEFPIITMWEI